MLSIRRPDGAWRWVRAGAYTVMDADDSGEVVLTLSDVTELRTASCAKWVSSRAARPSPRRIACASKGPTSRRSGGREVRFDGLLTAVVRRA